MMTSSDDYFMTILCTVSKRKIRSVVLRTLKIQSYAKVEN